MLSPSPKTQTPVPVILRLMDGTRVEGILSAFSPYQEHLELEVPAEDPETGSAIRTFKRWDVAYVLFKEPLFAPLDESRPPLGLRQFKIHTVGGEIFRVKLIATHLTNSRGFLAYPQEADAPYAQIYFFPHGVLATERDERLGRILLEEGAIHPEDLEKGLKTQESERKKRLGEILVEQEKLHPEALDEAIQLQQRRRLKIGELLLEMGLVSEEELSAALEEQKKRKGKRLGEVLVEMGALDEHTLTSALALKFQIPFVDLDDYPVDLKAANLLPLEQLRRLQVLPVRVEDRTVTIAISDPLNVEAHDTVRFLTSMNVQEVMVTPTQLREHLARIQQAKEEESDLLSEAASIELAALEELEEGPEAVSIDVLKQEADEPPIIRLANQIIAEGIQKKASDIHLTPTRQGLEYALRIHGTLVKRRLLDMAIQRRLIPRFKLMAGMDIAERRLPQDGRIRLKHGKQEMELRVSCIPNLYGESLVLRLLSKEADAMLHDLGLRKQDEEALLGLMERQFGLILVTGPTGSGKSTTLSAMLGQIANKGRNIVSVEDPVEYEVPGVNHIQVNPRIGMDFARVLRHILRHDPDVIMVGEIRDHETAAIGVEAALTGHLMLSTLHTNTAVDTIIRLTDMGIPAFLVAPSVLAILSQILCRVLCRHCKKEVPLKPALERTLERMGLEPKGPLFDAEGCEKCGHTAAEGRMLIYEFLEATEPLRAAVHEGASSATLQELAIREGMIPKAKFALEAAQKGIISQSELLRALG